MDLRANDLKITVGMTIVVVMMSFLFPALGLGGQAQGASDIPEFNISKNTADFAKEEPTFPSRPSQGTLSYLNGSEDWQDGRQVYLQQAQDPKYLLSFFDDDPGPSEQYHVNLIKFNSSGSFTNDVNINESEAKTVTSVDGAYEVGLENLNVTSSVAGNESATVEWEVLSQPSDQSWLGRIPGVGALLGATDQLAAILGWFVAMWYHVQVLIMNVIANTLVIFLNIFIYFIDFSWWLTSTYGSIVSGASQASAWAGVIVAIPGVILGFQFTKLIAVGVKLLPFT